MVKGPDVSMQENNETFFVLGQNHGSRRFHYCNTVDVYIVGRRGGGHTMPLWKKGDCTVKMPVFVSSHSQLSLSYLKPGETTKCQCKHTSKVETV